MLDKGAKSLALCVKSVWNNDSEIEIVNTLAMKQQVFEFVCDPHVKINPSSNAFDRRNDEKKTREKNLTAKYIQTHTWFMWISFTSSSFASRIRRRKINRRFVVFFLRCALILSLSVSRYSHDRLCIIWYMIASCALPIYLAFVYNSRTFIPFVRRMLPLRSCYRAAN